MPNLLPVTMAHSSEKDSPLGWVSTSGGSWDVKLEGTNPANNLPQKHW